MNILANLTGLGALTRLNWASWMAQRSFFFLLAFGWLITPLIYLFVWATAAGGGSICDCDGIKPTVGLVSRDGIIPISHTQDTAGPMARSVRDAAALLTAMASHDRSDPAAEASFALSCSSSFSSLRLRSTTWATLASRSSRPAISGRSSNDWPERG